MDAGTLAIEVTRVVVDGKVIESDGKTENAQHVLALDPFTLATLKEHVAQLDQELKGLGPDYQNSGVLAFTMKQYVQTDLEADRQVAATLAELILGGMLAWAHITGSGDRV